MGEAQRARSKESGRVEVKGVQRQATDRKGTPAKRECQAKTQIQNEKQKEKRQKVNVFEFVFHSFIYSKVPWHLSLVVTIYDSFGTAPHCLLALIICV